jgi:hypothetical protein
MFLPWHVSMFLRKKGGCSIYVLLLWIIIHKFESKIWTLWLVTWGSYSLFWGRFFFNNLWKCKINLWLLPWGISYFLIIYGMCEISLWLILESYFLCNLWNMWYRRWNWWESCQLGNWFCCPWCYQALNWKSQMVLHNIVEFMCFQAWKTILFIEWVV